MKFPDSLHFLHGADYNPEQWLGYPDILEQDIVLMKKAHINCVTLGIFSWAHLEPSEGVYNFTWLEEIINNLYKNGIYTILATPSGAKPNWMSEAYEEIRRVGADGIRELQRERHNHCFTSPIYREKTANINRRLAKQFLKHPGVILWHISNEYGGECYCPLCAKAFRIWLRNKYGSLEQLNHEWWAHFWSHTYTDWTQIKPPTTHGEVNVHGLNLDWKRFITYQTIDFMRVEIAAIREVDSHTPVTTNFMEFYEGLNYFKFAPYLDVVSWDSYPLWHRNTVNEIDTAVHTAFAHDLMRSIKQTPFLLMESTPSQTNWQGVSRLKIPGIHMLSSIQALAHGSNSVQYFQWRKSRGSSEKFHGAVVDHSSRDDSRVFREVTELGKRLEAIAALENSCIRPKVAILYDWENRWAIADTRGPRNIGMHYLETIEEHYHCFWEMGVNVDILDMECSLNGYNLIVAPMLYMYRAGIVDKLRAFVEQGGCLVGTYMSGVVNENDLCFLGDAPGMRMSEVFGIRREEIDALHDNQSNIISMAKSPEKTWTVNELCEIIHIQSACVIASYASDFYKGKPVLTCNHYGKGEAWYIAAKPEKAFLSQMYSELAKKLNLCPTIVKELPPGVTVSRRSGENEYFIFQNYLQTAVDITLSQTLVNIETKQKTKIVHLECYGSAIMSFASKA